MEKITKLFLGWQISRSQTIFRHWVNRCSYFIGLHGWHKEQRCLDSQWNLGISSCLLWPERWAGFLLSNVIQCLLSYFLANTTSVLWAIELRTCDWNTWWILHKVTVLQDAREEIKAWIILKFKKNESMGNNGAASDEEGNSIEQSHLGWSR